jgi:hypothetical protein
MDQLHTGDRVLGVDLDSKRLVFTTIHGFTKTIANQSTEHVFNLTLTFRYIELVFHEGSMAASDIHWVFISKTPFDPPRDVQMNHVEVGDWLWVAKNRLVPKQITRIQRVTRPGIWNVFTTTGTIIVNGVLASTYTNDGFGGNHANNHWLSQLAFGLNDPVAFDPNPPQIYPLIKMLEKVLSGEQTLLQFLLHALSSPETISWWSA